MYSILEPIKIVCLGSTNILLVQAFSQCETNKPLVVFILGKTGGAAAPKDAGKKQQKKSESDKEPKKQESKKKPEVEEEEPDAAELALSLEPKQRDPFTDIPAG